MWYIIGTFIDTCFFETIHNSSCDEINIHKHWTAWREWLVYARKPRHINNRISYQMTYFKILTYLEWYSHKIRPYLAVLSKTRAESELFTTHLQYKRGAPAVFYDSSAARSIIPRARRQPLVWHVFPPPGPCLARGVPSPN